jgi:hypothetical protein
MRDEAEHQGRPFRIGAGEALPQRQGHSSFHRERMSFADRRAPAVPLARGGSQLAPMLGMTTRPTHKRRDVGAGRRRTPCARVCVDAVLIEVRFNPRALLVVRWACEARYGAVSGFSRRGNVSMECPARSHGDGMLGSARKISGLQPIYFR